MKKTFPFHCFLFALYPIAFLYSKNIEEVGFNQVLLPSLLSVLIAGILLLIGRIIFRDIAKAALLASAFLILFFAYSNLFKLAGGMKFFTMQHRYLLLLYAVIFLGLFWVVIKSKRNLNGVTGAFNIISLALLLFNAGTIIYQKATSQLHFDEDNSEIKAQHFSVPENKPDIYYIILDGYAREDVLKQVHGMDNSEFISGLRNRGFYVADSSHSNYSHTIASIPSALNFEFLKRSPSESWASWREMCLMVQKNRTFALLKKLGYQTVAFPSGYEFSELKNSDQYISYPHLDDFSINLLNMTPLMNMMMMNSVAIPRQRNLILFPFQNIQKNKTLTSPKAVFIHVICPHPPYVFGENGEIIKQHDNMWFSNDWGSSENYVNQVKFINKLVLPTVDSIFANTTNSPIIIIQGDHGSKMNANYKYVDGNDFHEQFSNLCAIHFPGDAQKALYPGITPVNIFRIMFNEYFGADFKMMPDSCYFYSEKMGTKGFLNVTERIREDRKKGMESSR